MRKTTFILPLLFPAFLTAEDWPDYRGPTGMGVIQEETKLPLRWDAKTGENILWKVLLPFGNGSPDHNQGSPIVAKGRVFVTNCVWSANADRKATQPEHHVTCYRLSDGKQLWDQVVKPGPWTISDLRGGYAAPTPASDGKRVYAAFGSSILHALTRDGKPIWSQIIPDHATFDVAMAVSPVVFGDTVILLTDRKSSKATIQAFDTATGRQRWLRKREKTSFGHVTPVLTSVNGRPQLLVSATNALQGIDPTNGEVIWSCKWGRGIWPVSSPVMAKGLVYCMGGRGGHPGLIVDPKGTGDITATHLKTKLDPSPSGLGSPVSFGDLVFRMSQPGVLRCVRITTGEELFKERLPKGIDPAVSPIITPDGLIYMASAGKTLVVRAVEKFEIISMSDLGDASRASAAVSEGKLILKGKTYLWCISKGQLPANLNR
jgi:outer membrane protein assembly factor BamB